MMSTTRNRLNLIQIIHLWSVQLTKQRYLLSNSRQTINVERVTVVRDPGLKADPYTWLRK